VEAAVAMPEDKFNFSPESLNIPGADYRGRAHVCLAGQGMSPLPTTSYGRGLPAISSQKTSRAGTVLRDLKAKADIVKFLKDSFALGQQGGGHVDCSEYVADR